MRLRVCIVWTMCTLASTGVLAKDSVTDSLVKLHVTQRSPDLVRPWTKANSVKTSGSGVIIDGHRILTNAHVVLHASQVFLQANQSTEKVTGKVLFIAPDLDLAIVTAEDESFFEGRKPLSLAKALPNIKDTVNVYGYPEGGDQLSITEGIISRIEYARLSYDGAALRIQVDAALNPGNSGGPAVVDGKIVGLVFSKISQADNIGYLIAAEEIARFLDDVADGTYDGKPAIRAAWFQTTENEALRDRLGLKRGDGGLMVRDLRVAEDDCPLRRWDVITHIGQHKIDQQGDVEVRDDLRLNFIYLVPQLAANGTVPLKILRDGETLDVNVDVTNSIDRLMPFLGNDYPRYFIHGPMLFTPMTQELATKMLGPLEMYMRYYGNSVPSRQYDRQDYPGEELVVLGYRLFPHETSKGYDSVSFALVEKINGTKVKNLAHLVELIRDAKGEYLTVTLCGRYELLVFHRQELFDVTEEILADEGIRNQFSDDLKEVWEGKKKDDKQE
ncbi:MAG: trypsin-like peptidase domain-containing protein [Pirellulales bacterium]|nr:trypsin-like peptidase domain-containing protein [Pirellulales bacterium]